MPSETWQGAESSRSAIKRRQQRRQRRRRAMNLPSRPQLLSDAAEPPEKVCKLPAGVARTPGHLGGGQASAWGARSLPGAGTCCCHLSRRAARRRWWARAPGEGTSRLEGTWLSLPARKARECRGSARLHSSSLLLPPSGSRWHHYLFAATPNDSSRFCRGGAVAVPRTRRWSLPLRQILHGIG